MRPFGLRRVLIQVALALAALTAWSRPASAQNENETVGFQSSHIFESGVFGESIDTLNGGLALDVSLGPSFAVSQNLSYQLRLSYSSKIWDRAYLDPEARVMGQSPVGLGFRLHFGRIYRDVTHVAHRKPDGSSGADVKIECRWIYVSPDGNEHELPTADPPYTVAGCSEAPWTYPADGSFVRQGILFNDEDGVARPGLSWPGTSMPPPIPTIQTSDGIRYVFGHFLQVNNLGGQPINSNLPIVPDTLTQRYNKEFGGWYVTKIEDLRSGARAIPPDGASTKFDSFVAVTYETAAGFEHLMTGISDITGRAIVLTNGCARVNPADPTSACRQDPALVGANVPNPIRTSTRLEKVRFPAFSGSTTPAPNVTAEYDLKYDYKDLVLLGCTDTETPPHTCPVNVTRNVLTDVVYPVFSTNVGAIDEQHRYRLHFIYNTWGELIGRTLPTGATVSYLYNDYKYILSGGGGSSYDAEANARAIDTKSISLTDGRVYNWHYLRNTAYYSNPTTVTVWDPFGNDTVYRFHASRLDARGFTGMDPEDGFAPDWDDGQNYQIEYYQGHGPSRQLVRTVKREYTADPAGAVYPHSRARSNVRMARETTIYDDAGGISRSSVFSDWDGKGHWRQRVETGFSPDEYRSVRTQYFGYGPDQWTYQEVTNGRTVARRTEQIHYPSTAAIAEPKLCASVQRATAPSVMNGPAIFDAAQGDLTTWLGYDASSGNVVETALSDAGHSALSCNIVAPPPEGEPCCGLQIGSLPVATYRAHYTWAAGGYLAIKEVAQSPAGTPPSYFGWKAINRSRDANTGLIWQSSDTAGTKTTYAYDSLGRPREIIPDTGEHPTRIEYVDILHSSVRQSAVTSTPSQYRCDTATGDAILTCFTYDSLGRMNTTEKRPSSSLQGVAYQKTSYDIDGRKTFESEWRFDAGPSAYCGNPGEEAEGQATCIGTNYDYHVFPGSRILDAFARVHRTSTSDGKTTDASYFGTSSRVTTHGVSGVEGLFDPTTTYVRDSFGQLTYVESPENQDAEEHLIPGGADAAYAYDVAGHLVQVDLYKRSGDGVQSRYYEYDSLGRLRRSTTPESGTTIITDYDALGNVRDQIDSAGIRRRSVYDPAGRLTGIFKTEPLGGSAGAEMQVLAQVYDVIPAGNPHTFANSAGRLVLSDVRDDDGQTILTHEYQYSGLNKRLSHERLYFSAFPVQADGFPLPLEINIQYGAFGLLTRLQYPEGQTGLGGSFAVNYGYSNGALVRATLDTGVELASITYNAAGGAKEVATQGYYKTLFTPDARSRPHTIEMGHYSQTTGVLSGVRDYSSGAYVYDGAGNISSIGDGPQANFYAYDGANRLVKAQVWSGGTLHDQVFQYDDYGNITDIRQSDSGVLVRHDAFEMDDSNEIFGTGRTLNRIRNIESLNSSVRFPRYDSRGNLARNDTGSGATTSAYDSLNRLSAFSVVTGASTSLVAAYKYDAQGTRVEQHDLNRQLRTYYVRDGQGSLLSEFRRTSLGTYVPEWSKHYLYLGGRLVGLRENIKPSPPSQLNAATNSSGNVILTWQANPLHETVAFYKVFRSPVGGTPNWTLLGSPAGLTFTDTTAVTQNKYKYQLTANNGIGEGYGSDLTIQSGDTTAPTVPRNLQAFAGDRRVDLLWDPPIVADIQLVVGYRVYRGQGGPGVCPILTESFKLLDLPKDRRTFVDLDVTNDSTYCYAVKAIDSAGLLSTSTPVLEVMPHDLTPPAPPRGLRAVNDCSGTTSIKVSWEINEPEDGQPLSYTLYRAPTFNVAPSAPVLIAGTNRLEVADTETVPGTRYSYWIDARDAQGNVSQASIRVNARSRPVGGSGLPPVPNSPVASMMDHVVTIQIPYATGRAARLYRRANIDDSCDDYQLIGELSPDQIPPVVFTFLDPGAPTNVASNYVTTYVDPSTGAESAYSRPALSIPVESPSGFRACLEIRPGTSAAQEGDVVCTGSPQSRRRVLVRWNVPGEAAYQPLWASNSSGRTSYIKGYRLYGYVQSGADVHRDTASLTAFSPARRVGGHCVNHDDLTCTDDTNCPSGSSCTYLPIAMSGFCSGSGTGGNRSCFSNLDCNSGTQCILSDDDPTLINDHETRAFLNCSGPSCNTCIGVKAVYKVYVDGNWATVESDPADNLHSDISDNPLIRCDRYIPDQLCSFRMDDSEWDGTLRQCSGDDEGPPPVPGTPTAAQGPPGEIQVSWPIPAAGKCQLQDLQRICGQFATPGDPLRCPPDQFCLPCNGENPSCDLTEGTCQLLTKPDCDPDAVLSQCSTGQVCEDQQVIGYRIQVDDFRGWGELLKHHFIYPVSAVTVPANTNSYTFRDLSYEDHFAFRVSVVDALGRTSEPSLFSRPSTSPLPPATPALGPPPPTAVRAIIWTVNDHVVPMPGNAAPADIRELNGVKISWRPGGVNPSSSSPNHVLGYRVYRSSAADGSEACLLVQAGDQSHPNPSGETVCHDEHDGAIGAPRAFSQTLTSPIEASNSNIRMAATDVGVLTGTTYYYYVKAVEADGDKSSASSIVSALELPHVSQPLSAPRGFKAWAPLRKVPNGSVYSWVPDRGIYLHWCGNPVVEGIAEYRIYRWRTSDIPWGPGATPYATIHMTNASEAACLDGQHRCEISGNNSPPVPTTCDFVGVEEDCRLVDVNVEYPVRAVPLSLREQVEEMVYYYAVAAVRDGHESPLSLVNQGWPNYCPTGGDCTEKRYDPDNNAEIACGDENALFRPAAERAITIAHDSTNASARMGVDLARGQAVSQSATDGLVAPYRMTGIIQNPNDDGGGGGTNSPPATYRMLYYHLDHLGSPRVIVDASGTVVSKHNYMPFGEEIPLEPQNSSNTRNFTGHERDSNTQQDYMLARYYRPILGRFVSPDPRGGNIGLPQSLNRYSYAGNNPINYIDPRGEDFQIPCSDESETCGRNKKGTLVEGRTNPDTGEFTPTTIRTPTTTEIAGGQARDGELIDNWGTTYSASYDGTTVTVTTTNQGSHTTSNTVWAPGTPPVTFRNTGSVFADLNMTITKPGLHQIVRGYVDLPAGVGVAEMMAKIGASPMIGIHFGIEFRTSGDPDTGSGSTHYVIHEATEQTPSTRINFHSGEIDPRVDMLHHACRDFAKLCS